MIIKQTYNHLNAREYLIVNKNGQFEEIKKAIESIDANNYLKISCDVRKIGQIFYSQGEINKAIKKILQSKKWNESRVAYYVTSDEETTREIVNITDKTKQRQIIEDKGFICFSTYNQVDFQKDRIALEVQFGKYFSVAYDLHVKHTFFYSRNDIDVGIEVIPTKAMEEHMDTGVPWFENEVTNVIREGRTNPPVPILIMGIEPNTILSRDPIDYNDNELIKILKNSDINKYKTKAENLTNISQDTQARIDKINQCLRKMGDL